MALFLECNMKTILKILGFVIGAGLLLLLSLYFVMDYIFTKGWH